MRPRVLECAISFPFSVKRRLGPMLLAGCLACILGASPLSACVQKNKAGGAWVTINGDNVTIKVSGFKTFNPGSGGGTCGCGLQKVASLDSLTSAEVRREDNGQKIEDFDFAPSPTVAGTFSGEDGGAPWFGFSAGISSVPTVPVDLVFTGKLASGATFDSLKTQLEAAGNNIGLGKVDTPGGLIVCPIGAIDRVPSAAPLIKVSRMAMANPHFVELSVLDAEDGLKTLRVVEAAGASETVPAFAPGTTAPVGVRFTMAGGKATASIGLEACNLLGDCSTWRGEVMHLKAGDDGRSSRDLAGVPPSSRLIKLQNGNPGVTMFLLTANGKRFSVRPLAAGQLLNLNAALAVDEPENALTLAAVGTPGSEVMVLVVEAAGEE